METKQNISEFDISRKLYENGIDFIQQSIKDFEAQNYKYSIINFACGVEVILKARIAADDWKLIVKTKKDELPDWEKLLKGEAFTINPDDCLNTVQGDKFNIVLRNGGESFKKLSKKRNKAIHFFLTDVDGDIDVIQFNAFEDLGIFLRQQSAKIHFDAEELKLILINLGKHVRKYKGISIDDFFLMLDRKKDMIQKSIATWGQYKKGVSQRIYWQELKVSKESQSSFSEWDEVTLGDICKVKSRRNSKDNPGGIRLMAKNDIVFLDATGGAKGLLVGEILLKDGIDVDYFSMIINLHQRFFQRNSQGVALKRIPFQELLKLRVLLPNEKEQKRIGDLLRSIDKKIALLHRQLELYTQYERGVKAKMYV